MYHTKTQTKTRINKRKENTKMTSTNVKKNVFPFVCIVGQEEMNDIALLN